MSTLWVVKSATLVGYQSHAPGLSLNTALSPATSVPYLWCETPLEESVLLLWHHHVAVCLAVLHPAQADRARAWRARSRGGRLLHLLPFLTHIGIQGAAHTWTGASFVMCFSGMLLLMSGEHG